MELIRSTLNRCDGVDHAKAPILVTMPVEPDPATLFFDDALHESHHGASTVRRRVLTLCSKRLAGWSIANHTRTELIIDAVRAAAAAREPTGARGDLPQR